MGVERHEGAATAMKHALDELKRPAQFGFIDGATVEGIEELRLGVTHDGAGGKDCCNSAMAREFKHRAIHLNRAAAMPMAQLSDRLAGATDGRSDGRGEPAGDARTRLGDQA